MPLHPAITAFRFFGSIARGDSDKLSDLDILLVQSRKTNVLERNQIESTLVGLGQRVSICWYSELTLAKMFKEGHLFAWHLFRESINPTKSHDFVDRLGLPKRYKTAAADIVGFQEILSGVLKSLAASPNNACYEAGIIFLCCRNAAMIASTYLSDGPYFDRNSPFRIARATGIEFPLSFVEHSENMKARAFAHRGTYVPQLHAHFNVGRMAEKTQLWMEDIVKYIENSEAGYERKKQAFC